jgi:membrane-bound metal-dependent hydrolase YbcI (DUF457 family)
MSPSGHLAIGFSAKKYAPQVPVIVFLIAAYSMDLLYFVLLALGIETSDYDPWSHSLLMAIIWSVLAGLITYLHKRELRSGLVIGLVVFSHWILDFIVWDNLPLAFDSSYRTGFGLYDRIGFTLTGLELNSGTLIATSIELGMLITGLAVYIIYLRKLRKRKAVPATK